MQTSAASSQNWPEFSKQFIDKKKKVSLSIVKGGEVEATGLVVAIWKKFPLGLGRDNTND